MCVLALCRAAAGKDGGKGHRKQGPKRIWSNLTTNEHAWYLAKQGEPLLSPSLCIYIICMTGKGCGASSAVSKLLLLLSCVCT